MNTDIHAQTIRELVLPPEDLNPSKCQDTTWLQLEAKAGSQGVKHYLNPHTPLLSPELLPH